MKRMMYVIIAVLMILPLIVSCGSKHEGTPTEVADVKVLSMYSAEGSDENATAVVDGNADTATAIYEGAVTAYVAEGATLTLKDVVDAYANDIDGDAFYDEDTYMYTKLAGLTANGDWFWNYKVNGKEVGLNTEIKATDSIEIIYQK